MKNIEYAILVNTTDSFEDCWLPFFKLFSIFWHDYKGKIYLNTETKTFSYPGLNIIPIRNHQTTTGRKPTWSECLLCALDTMSEAIVLYMQEDYFLWDFVKNDLINEFANLISVKNIDCIHLTDQATPGPFQKTSFEQLLEIDKKAPYRISTQVALWKKDVLKQYLRKHENAWQFELYATRRARILNHKLFNVDTDIYIQNLNEILPYIFTGIIKGKWNKQVMNLFEDHGLKIDYSNRGFYVLGHKKNIITRFLDLGLYFKIFKSEIDLLKLRICRN